MSGCRYIEQVLTIETPKPAKLVVLTSKRRARFICISQVHRTCLSNPRVCLYDHVKKACCKVNKHILLTGDDKAMLSKLGGLPNAAAHGTIVTVAACYKALQQPDIPAQMLSVFLDLKTTQAIRWMRACLIMSWHLVLSPAPIHHNCRWRCPFAQHCQTYSCPLAFQSDMACRPIRKHTWQQ